MTAQGCPRFWRERVHATDGKPGERKRPRGHQSPTKVSDCLYMNVVPKERSWWSQQASGMLPQTGAQTLLVLKPLYSWSLPQTPTFMRPIAKPPYGHSRLLTGCEHGLENLLGKLIWAGLLVTTEDRVRHLLIRDNRSLHEMQRPLHMMDQAQLALRQLRWDTESEARAKSQWHLFLAR